MEDNQEFTEKENKQKFTEEDIIYFKKVFDEILKHLVPPAWLDYINNEN